MQQSPNPQAMESTGAVSVSRQEASRMIRQAWMEGARRDGDDNNLWLVAQSMWSSINHRFALNQDNEQDWTVDLHDLWFIYCHASLNISDQSPCQDRLVLQILKAREQGTLGRRDSNGAVIHTAITADGLIWTDLPYLVSDMTEFWITHGATMSGPQRLNFSSFLARLASVGTVSDKLAGVALIVLRDTLESERAVGHLGDNNEEDSGRTDVDLSIAALLPSANVWLFQAGAKIVDLAEKSWNHCPSDVGESGVLLRQDQSNPVVIQGFTRQRWLFWLRRLQEISERAGSVGEYASRVLDNMLLIVEERDSVLRADVEAIRGTAIRHETPMHMLEAGSGSMIAEIS